MGVAEGVDGFECRLGLELYQNKRSYLGLKLIDMQSIGQRTNFKENSDL